MSKKKPSLYQIKKQMVINIYQIIKHIYFIIEGDSFTNQKLNSDYYISIEHTRFLNIPYFLFGFTYNFYFPYTKLPNKIKLSEIPNPPYTLGPNGKNIII